MKRSFEPNEVIDLTEGEPKESEKPRAKKSKKAKKNGNNRSLERFDSSHSREVHASWWNGNNGHQARAWGQQFQHRENNVFHNDTPFGRGGFNQGQGQAGPSTSRPMNGHGGRQNNHQQRPDFQNRRPDGYPRPRSHGGDDDRRHIYDKYPDDFFIPPDPDVFSHPSERFRQGLNPDPDSFRQVALFLTQRIPDDIIHTDKKWKRLTTTILNKFCESQQTMPSMEKKIDFWKQLYEVIRSEFDCGIFIFGSTFNGFGNKASDMDMNIWLDRTEKMPDKEKLCAVRRLLRKFWSQNIRGGRAGIELIPAKVPILKFKDTMANLDIDLSVNNPTSIRNTHLLYHYSTLDYRVRPLVNAVKCWAKSAGINDASCQTLSSYAWTLMVIHFLQFRVRPRVLPCLHDAYPHIFFSRSNIFNLDYSVVSTSFKSENQQSLGDLMAQFFHYYAAEFDYETDVASIRRGYALEKDECETYARSMKLSPGQWRAHMLLEEPFDRTNAARAVCNEAQFDKIKTCIQDVDRYLMSLKTDETKNITLHNLCMVDKLNEHKHFN